jgi:hypothetical protein
MDRNRNPRQRHKEMNAMAMIEGKMLTVLLVGFTHYVDVGKGEDAIIFYENARDVRMLLPGAAVMKGEWKLLPDGYFVKWQGGPEGKWQIGHEIGVFTYFDPGGKPAGTITKIVPGNAAAVQ